MYTLTLNSVKILNTGGFTEKILDYDPKTNNIHIRIAGINLETLVDADFKALNIIPFQSTAMNVTNMTIDFKVAAQTKPDGVHWHMNETAKITIGDISIKMKNGFLDRLVRFNRKLINFAVNNALVPYLEKLLTAEVELVNKMVAGEGSYTFYDQIFGGENAGINLTMTTAPQVVGKSDLVKIFFDGLYIPRKGSGIVSAVDFHSNLKTYPPRLQHSLSQQFWINQDVFNSLMEINKDAFFPQTFNSSSVSDAIYKAFPTLQNNCNGSPAAVAYSLEKSGSPTHQSIIFNSKYGIILGGQDFDVRSTIDIQCKGQDIFSFNSKVQTVMNVTMSNFVLYSSITDQTIFDTRLTKGDLDPSGMYSDQLTAIAAAVQDSFNAQYAKGWALSHIDPRFAMAAGLVKNTTLSPFVTDGWMLAGFEMNDDLPTEEPILEFIE